MSRYKAYSEYKNSGVDNLDEIPSTWEVMQLKRSVLDCVNGIWGNEPENDGNDTIVIRVADFDRPKLSIVDEGFTYRKIEQKEKRSRLLKCGDLLLEKSGGGEKTLVGQVVIFDKDFAAVTSNFVAKMTPHPRFFGGYLNYVFSHFYSGNINYCSIKQNTGIQNLDSASYLAEKFGFPSLLEQEKIAAFLDHETAKIDALIEKQQRLIELLKEKRQAVISHAVTKGLKPSAPMKDSGVEWLGEVPAHWRVPKLINQASRIGDGLHAAPQYEDGTEIYFINGNNLVDGKIVIGSMAKEVPEFEYKKNYIELNESTVLLSINGTVGNVARYRQEKVVLGKSAAYINCFGSLLSEYLMFFLQSSNARRYYELEVTGTTIFNLSLASIRRLRVPLPSESEQVEIVNFCESQKSKYESLIDKAIGAISLMQERRTALISAAVTGKIDVRDWQAAA